MTAAFHLPFALLALVGQPSTTATTSTASEPFDSGGRSDALTDSVFEDSPAPESIAGSPHARGEFFIEQIEIVGNAKTHRSVILKKLVVAVGDLVDESLIEESRLRLLNTGFFQQVELSLRRGSERGQVLLVVEVVERNTILIDDLYYGYSSV